MDVGRNMLGKFSPHFFFYFPGPFSTPHLVIPGSKAVHLEWLGIFPRMMVVGGREGEVARKEQME